MIDEVPPAQRDMPTEARETLLGHDLRHRHLLTALMLVCLGGFLLTLANATPGLWVALAPAQVDAAATEVSRGPDGLTIKYEYFVGDEAYRGEANGSDEAVYDQVPRGGKVAVTYCRFWPGQSLAHHAASGNDPFLIGIAAMLFAMFLPLVIISVRKRRRIAQRIATYRNGEPAEGTFLSLEHVRIYRGSHASLRYKYTVAANQAAYRGPEKVSTYEGEVTAISTSDLEGLCRNPMIILYLPDAPEQSIPFWPEAET